MKSAPSTMMGAGGRPGGGSAGARGGGNREVEASGAIYRVPTRVETLRRWEPPWRSCRERRSMGG